MPKQPANARTISQAASRRKLAFFAHDANESTVTKRALAFAAEGVDVVGLMFKRKRDRPDQTPAWRCVDLGVTTDRNYLRRIPQLFSAFVTIVRHRTWLTGCQVFYARNIDMLLLAVAVRLALRLPATIIYEVLDVQRVFLRADTVGTLMRWAERRLMSFCALLVVSSQDFMDHYFVGRQNYRGPWYLLENKVPAAAMDRSGATHRLAASSAAPWTIGWFGVLRCHKSLASLAAIADDLGDQVRIVMRGLPSHEDVTHEQIAAVCAQRPNMYFGGPYRNPLDLAAIYGEVDFAWCVDYLDQGSNSDWLLPNRIYEGGLYGALALSRRGTATGRKVERERLGVALDEPIASGTVALLHGLTRASHQVQSERLRALPAATFVDLADTKLLLGVLFGSAETSQSSVSQTTPRRASPLKPSA
jgi:succinoglycan biosynthesis protein ExoL